MLIRVRPGHPSVWVATVLLVMGMAAPGQAGQEQALIAVSATVQASVAFDLTTLPTIAGADGFTTELPGALVFSCTRGLSPRLSFSGKDLASANPNNVLVKRRSLGADIVYFRLVIETADDLTRFFREHRTANLTAHLAGAAKALDSDSRAITLTMNF